jgi:hypothetical protein
LCSFDNFCEDYYIKTPEQANKVEAD